MVSKYVLFSPLFGEDFPFDEHIFQMGWFNHQPEVSLGSTGTTQYWHFEGLVSGSPDAKNVYKLSFWGGGV